VQKRYRINVAPHAKLQLDVSDLIQMLKKGCIVFVIVTSADNEQPMGIRRTPILKRICP